MLTRRFLLLLALLCLVGLATHAFAAGPLDRTSTYLTRGEAVALLVSSREGARSRAAWFAGHVPPMPLFRDVSQTAWYVPSLEAAFEQGWIRGSPDPAGNPLQTLFRPNDFLRGEEAVALLVRFREKPTERPLMLMLPGSQKTIWYSQALRAAVGSIDFPTILMIGKPIERLPFYALLRSQGITSPETIALVMPPVGMSPASTVSSRENGTKDAGHRTDVVRRTTQGSQLTAHNSQLRRTPAPRPRGATASVASPTRAAVSVPSRTFSISLPTLGVNHLTVTHPSDPFTSQGLLAPLTYGVGHLFSYPGSSGKILIYGHSSGYPWDVSSFTKIFRQINKLNVGDRVFVDYQGETYVYEVSAKETVPAKDMSAYKSGGSEELILYTCWPPDSISQRYLVHARPVEKIAAR